MPRTSTKRRALAAEADIERALALLRDDPPRLRRLLRETAALADDVAGVLEDAKAEDLASSLRRTAKKLRAGALLPALMSVALLRAAYKRVLATV